MVTAKTITSTKRSLFLLLAPFCLARRLQSLELRGSVTDRRLQRIPSRFRALFDGVPGIFRGLGKLRQLRFAFFDLAVKRADLFVRIID